MRKATHILMAISILALAASLIFPSLDDLNEWITRPSDPEEIFDSIIDDGARRIKLLYRDDFPIEIVIGHLRDERVSHGTLYATQGPNRAWMLSERVLQDRLGLGGDPDLREKRLMPLPEFFSRHTFHEWWEASSKDEMLIRFELATWQLAELEKDPDQSNVDLHFKRRQVAEFKRQLDAR